MVAETEKMRFQKGDWLAIGLVVILAISVAACFVPQNDQNAAVAELYLNGEKIRTLSLAEEQTFSVTDRYTNEITVAGGKIAITQSDCPGEDCVHSGFIGSTGRSVVCLPNGLEIRVVAGQSDVDFVVG